MGRSKAKSHYWGWQSKWKVKDAMIISPHMPNKEKLSTLQTVINQIAHFPAKDGLPILNVLYKEHSLSLKVEWIVLYKINNAFSALPYSMKEKYYNIFLKYHNISEVQEYLQIKTTNLLKKIQKLSIDTNDKGTEEPKSLWAAEILVTNECKTEKCLLDVYDGTHVSTFLDIYHRIIGISTEISNISNTEVGLGGDEAEALASDIQYFND